MPTCKRCGRLIRWCRTATGCFVPLDPEPVDGGTVFLLGSEGIILPPGTRPDRPLYRRHALSCEEQGREAASFL